MHKEFLEDIFKSGYIHRPLELDESRSFEQRHKDSHVSLEQVLFSPKHKDLKWKHRGRGQSLVNDNELQLTATHIYSSWPEGAPDDGDYTNYGQVTAYCHLDHVDMNQYNRIYFEVKADCPGMVNPHMMLSIKNDGQIKVPDIYNREGYHTINLKNKEWNQCFVEITDLPRDAVTEIAFTVLMNGKDRATLDEIHFSIRYIALQQVDSASLSLGWQPLKNQIIYSHNGYQMTTHKIAIMNETQEKTFQLICQKNNHVIYENKIQNIQTEIGTYAILDFSEFEIRGDYYLQIGHLKSEVFPIDDYQERWGESIYRSLNFIFCERCGCPVPDIHGSCHEDILATHNGQTIIFNGGWHDAGDVSQQLVQTAEVTLALFEMSHKLKEQDKQLYLRLLEEAEWGFDFILKTRFGDGYRATSAGITRWSDCLIGNMDDTVARVHNNAYENFLLAGIEGQIALLLDNNRLQDKAIAIAQEDYTFALEKFMQDGFKHEPIFWEHTYNMSESLFLATMVWSSCILYQLTNEINYAQNAKKWADELLKCQECDGIELFDKSVLKGFFYRDHTHQVIQHFNHQAREHMYAKALDMLVETHICDEMEEIYLKRMKDYGEYLKYLMKFTYPYPMIASGVYLEDEYLDDESFHRQHLLVGDEAKESYLEQLKEAHHVAKNLYVKKFPVWFSFKGNNGILLSMGKSASLIGKRLNDNELLEIAEGQLQWMVGMNPFGQSLVYGEGYDYAQQYSVQTGEMVGEMPVGVQTFENGDEPYWPQFTNATYKEVWVGLAGKWMDILVDFYKK